MRAPKFLPTNFRRLFVWLLPGLMLAVLAVLATNYKVQVLPPSLERDSAEYAAATTELMVDFPGESALHSTRYPVGGLAERAGIYARLATSPAIRLLIGEEAEINPAKIDVVGPYNPDTERAVREPTAERRALQLQAEQQSYRIRFDVEGAEAVPIVLIYAQAPTVSGAEGLADAGAAGLIRYVKGIQNAGGLEESKRLQLRPLGAAVGGVVNPGADQQIAALVFVAVLLAWSVLVAIALRLRQMVASRRAGRSSQVALSAEPTKRSLEDPLAETSR